jgi:hypothetical protein
MTAQVNSSRGGGMEKSEHSILVAFPTLESSFLAPLAFMEPTNSAEARI